MPYVIVHVHALIIFSVCVDSPVENVECLHNLYVKQFPVFNTLVMDFIHFLAIGHYVCLDSSIPFSFIPIPPPTPENSFKENLKMHLMLILITMLCIKVRKRAISCGFLNKQKKLVRCFCSVLYQLVYTVSR